jgi:hypothetical protein
LQKGPIKYGIPALQMAAVVTGWNDNELMRQPLDMLERYILPAAVPALPATP